MPHSRCIIRCRFFIQSNWDNNVAPHHIGCANEIVFPSYPTVASPYCNEYLQRMEPWVHYVPIAANLSDLAVDRAVWRIVLLPHHQMHFIDPYFSS